MFTKSQNGKNCKGARCWGHPKLVGTPLGSRTSPGVWSAFRHCEMAGATTLERALVSQGEMKVLKFRFGSGSGERDAAYSLRQMGQEKRCEQDIVPFRFGK